MKEIKGEKKFNGIILAGTNSGCGKTTFSIGMMAALKKQGLSVQPFKIGPDYLDPMLHSFVTDRKSINLDSWMLEKKTLQYLFCSHLKSEDFCVIEGVMGLYDGFGTTEKGSTAEVAKILNCPVILVMNAQGMSTSAAAVLQGFCNFDSKVPIKGVLFNRVKSESQYQLLKKIVEKNTTILPLGYLKEDSKFQLESRHLGLKAAEESNHFQEKVEQLADSMLETVDFEIIKKMKIDTKPIFLPEFCTKKKNKKIRIGVAKDEAFSFYYEDNFRLLKWMGAELVFFSPIRDCFLPEGIQGLYFGGGYPELHVESLAKNESIKKEIQRKAEEGMPIYGECGGFLYLCNTLNGYPMAGVLQGNSYMTESLGHFGYVEVELIEDCIFGRAGQKMKAHEFHYSKTKIAEEHCMKVSKERDGKITFWESGYYKKNVVGSYPHLHFWSNPFFAEAFINQCRGE